MFLKTYENVKSIVNHKQANTCNTAMCSNNTIDNTVTNAINLLGSPEGLRTAKFIFSKNAHVLAISTVIIDLNVSHMEPQDIVIRKCQKLLSVTSRFGIKRRIKGSGLELNIEK